MAARATDGRLHLRNGVRWGRDVAGVDAVKHGQVIEVVARREDLLRLQPEHAGDFREGGPLAVAGVAEAEVLGVADDSKVRDLLAFFEGPSVNQVGVLRGLRNDGEGRPLVLVEHGIELRLDPPSDALDPRLRSPKEHLVVFTAGPIPGLVFLVARPRAAMDVALHRDDEVGACFEPERGENEQHIGAKPPGVDHPHRTPGPHLVEMLHEIPVHGIRCGPIVDGPIEVGGDEADHGLRRGRIVVSAPPAHNHAHASP